MMNFYHLINQKLINHNEACLSVFDLGLLRGYGVFDYVPLYDGHPFHLNEHIQRLRRSAEKMELQIPYTDEEIVNFTNLVIENNPPVNAGLRFIVTAGISSNTFLPTGDPSFLILFQTVNEPAESIYQEGMKAITTRQLRFLPNVKSTNYFPSVSALKNAVKSGCDDALFINDQDEILEGTTSNVFFFKNGTLFTDNSDLIINGVTRDIVLEIAKNYYPIELKPITLSDLKNCQEAFFTSSIKDLIPLVQIDQIKIGDGKPGPFTNHLRSLFRIYRQNYLTKLKSKSCLLKTH